MVYILGTYNKTKEVKIVSLGQYLKDLREGKMSLRETARRAGISSSYLSQLENGHNKRPNKDVLKKLASALDTTYISLLMKTDLVQSEVDKRAEIAMLLNESSDHDTDPSINPEGFPQPNTLKKTINVPSQYKIGEETKHFENSDLLDLYYLIHLAIDNNDNINLTFKNKPIDKSFLRY